MEELRLDVARIRRAEVVETRGKKCVASRLAHVVVVERFGSGEPCPLASGAGLGQSLRRRRRESSQRRASRRAVLLVPHRVRVAHLLSPVRHHVARIDPLRTAKGGRGLRTMKVVEVEHPTNELAVRSRRRGRRKVDSTPSTDEMTRSTTNARQWDIRARAACGTHLGARYASRVVSASPRSSCANANPCSSRRRGTHRCPCSAIDGSVPMR